MGIKKRIQINKISYGYFLIWGHGLKYAAEVLNILRRQKDIKILRIMGHKPKSIAGLVRKIYSYDYAPFEHLKGKTKYLITTIPETLFIFYKNENAQERYFGKGRFLHTECERIKKLKDDIRNEYNPKKEDGNRSEDHVVHASDNESQVSYILKYLGFKEGIKLLKKSPNPILPVPYYIPKFDNFVIRNINSAQIYCNILNGDRKSYRKVAYSIEDTPQFAFLTGNKAKYQEYLTKWCVGGPITYDYSFDKLEKLSKEFSYLKEPHGTSYILTNEFEKDKYMILDGVHRASILKSRGVDKFPIAVMK